MFQDEVMEEFVGANSQERSWIREKKFGKLAVTRCLSAEDSRRTGWFRQLRYANTEILVQQRGRGRWSRVHDITNMRRSRRRSNQQ